MPRGLLARRPPAAGQPHVVLRRQPDLHRGRHRHRVQRGRRARYAAYGWHVQRVDWRPDTRRHGDYDEDVDALHAALEAAATPRAAAHRAAHHHRLAARRTSRTPASIHGSALGADEVAATKEAARLRPQNAPSRSTGDVLAHAREVVERGARHTGVGQALRRVAQAEPGRRRAVRPPARAGACPTGWRRAARVFPPTARASPPAPASGKVLGALAPVLPELWGGSADLAETNNTTMEGEPSFIPRASRPTSCRATRTAARCTSASASTPWARSSTASRCTAAPAPTAAPSWSSATTCARRCGWPR